MTIYYAAAATTLALVFAAMILRKYRTTRKASARYQLPLRLLSTLTPNCFQCIRLYAPEALSDKIKHISTTLSLSKDFDPFHLLYTDQQAYFFVNALFTAAFPCFYIFSKRSGLAHHGKRFSRPFLLNRTKYGMLGHISDAVCRFAEKYSIVHFYSSYVPREIFDADDPVHMKSSLELKIRLEDFSDEMIGDLLMLFKDLEEEKEKKYERITREYRVWKNEQDSLEKRGFFEKVLDRSKKATKKK